LILDRIFCGKEGVMWSGGALRSECVCRSFRYDLFLTNLKRLLFTLGMVRSCIQKSVTFRFVEPKIAEEEKKEASYTAPLTN
jgi:hypothetical protein